MTNQPNQELPPAKRRRLIIGAVLRGLLVTTVLVILYYLLPLDQPWDTGTAVRLLIGLLVFAGLTVWQVRAVIGSRYPAMRAFETLGLIIPFYLLLFASTYFVMERASAANFTQPLTRTDALYFSVTVFTTVGFGDIAAKSETARVRAHRPDARRPGTAGRRRPGAAGGGAPRPATKNRRRRWPGHRMKACPAVGPAGWSRPPLNHPPRVQATRQGPQQRAPAGAAGRSPVLCPPRPHPGRAAHRLHVAVGRTTMEDSGAVLAGCLLTGALMVRLIRAFLATPGPAPP